MPILIVVFGFKDVYGRRFQDFELMAVQARGRRA